MNRKFSETPAVVGKRRVWSRTGTLFLLGLVAAGVGASQPPDPTSSDGNNNTAGGSYALYSLTSGSRNTGFGDQTLYENTSGTANTAVGAQALFYNTLGGSNIAIGYQALTGNVQGNYNTVVGTNAADTSNFSGSSNTLIGYEAGQGLTSGSNNIAIGNEAGAYLGSSASNNILIGSSSGCGSNTNTICLGSNGTHTAAYIAGVSGVSISSGADVVISSGGQLGTVVSSAQYKKDIQDMGDDSARLAQLRPVTFHYKADPAQEKQYGLIAEEVAQVYPDLVVRDQQGKVQSVQYHALIPMLLNELQRQQREVQALKDENAGLRTALQTEQTQTQARLTRLEQQITHSAVVASR